MTATGDPRGRRALFEAAQHDGSVHPNDGQKPADTGHHGEGRRALFSAGQRRPGTVVVECSRCEGRAPISVVALAWHLVPSVWIPGRRWSRWMRCPTCHRLTWCRIDWRDSLPWAARGRPA